MSTFVPANEQLQFFLQARELIKKHFSHPTETITNHQLQNSSCRVQKLCCKKIPRSVYLVPFLLIQLNTFFNHLEDANWPVLCICLGGNKIVFRLQSVIEDQLKEQRKHQQGKAPFVAGKFMWWKRISISSLLPVCFEDSHCFASRNLPLKFAEATILQTGLMRKGLTGGVSAFGVQELVSDSWYCTPETFW